MMEVIKILVAPILVALVSWLIKDYIFAQQKAKQEMLRTEWQNRLTNFWSPLFLWSGLVFFHKFGNGENTNKAVSELTALLAANAHLIPKQHYYVIISLIEKATALPEKEVDMNAVGATRSYIYRQIEMLNYLLYKRDSSFEPITNISFVSAPLALLRATANASAHIITWTLVGGFLYLGYFLFKEGQLLLLIPYSFVFLIPIWADMERRIEMRREAIDHRVFRLRYGLLATVRWCRGKLS